MENKPHQPQEIDLDTYKDLSVGQILQRTREHYGQSINQVEVNLRIRASYIRALEEENIEALPGRVYMIGFVRAYSEYLGLDGDKMVYLFKAQTIGKQNRPQLQFPVMVHDSQTPNIYVVLGCLVTLILILSYLSMTYESPRHVEIIPPVPPELKRSSLVPDKPESIEDIIESEERTNNNFELVISEDSWVELKDANGKSLISEVLKPGDKYIIPDGNVLTLNTGNAGGITVFIDGKKVRVLGEQGEVKRNITLSREEFQ
ncbi:MAG: RodZ domain-containing protein [Pseudomonadota bacterium]